ncbi:hypothetical protein SPI_03887 [Niveomyces insectorum RCEF 264]|uniref:Uncharacterized protein n=1 Tax=Niveomyces insectorum RCEF 264 TaxID=1081102 RepID=A0A167WFG6_9HYPO|nr:hypothetical protein SPI_03887 [Niveomyces insectorum RCEF 264]
MRQKIVLGHNVVAGSVKRARSVGYVHGCNSIAHRGEHSVFAASSSAATTADASRQDALLQRDLVVFPLAGAPCASLPKSAAARQRK